MQDAPPAAVQPRVPIWVGGRTRRSLRRAVELGDGWMPFGLGAKEIRTMLDAVPPPEDFRIVLSTAPLDPMNNPQQARDQLRILEEIGATDATCALSARSATHYCEQLAALTSLAQH